MTHLDFRHGPQAVTLQSKRKNTLTVCSCIKTKGKSSRKYSGDMFVISPFCTKPKTIKNMPKTKKATPGQTNAKLPALASDPIL